MIQIRGVTLVELLVVLAIVAGLLGLLLPATQRARARARSAVCQNNLRQISLAAQNHRELGNKFPVRGQSWTITLLQWMEERPLMEAIGRGNVNAAIGKRPPIFECPSQPEIRLEETGIRPCHNTLEMEQDRNGKWNRLFGIRDRIQDFEGEEVRPWYEGPISLPLGDSAKSKQGPHGGLFNRS